MNNETKRWKIATEECDRCGAIGAVATRRAEQRAAEEFSAQQIEEKDRS